jgi:hypothetical protein
LNRLKRIGLSLVLLGGALIGVWSVRLAGTALSLRAHLSEVNALLDGSDDLQPEALCALVHDLGHDVQAIRAEAGGLADLLPALGWLPWVGGDLRAAPHLLAAAEDLTECGALVCGSLEPALLALTGEGGGGVSLPEIIELIDGERESLGRALSAAERAEEAWSAVEQQSLSGWLSQKVAPLDRGLPLLPAGLEMLLAAPELAGAHGPQTYLVLALNEDELRPTGGFITGVGEVQIEAGEIVTMTFRDSYAVDDFTEPYPYPPEPLQRYMGIDQWVFRDSNWSPDFPTAARQAVSLYRPGYAVSVAGVVALDQQAVRRVVEAIGPLVIGETQEPVTGETVVSYIQEAWAPEGGEMGGGWWAQRKSFMGDLAAAAWQRVRSGEVEWLTLGRTLFTLLEEKHLLVHVENPVVTEALASAGWDGALHSGAGDFLMVVDANVGYNKASARVQQELVYEVDLRTSPPRASLTIVYTHTSSADYGCLHEIRYDPVYVQMMDRCCWNYVRVYVPDGSQLLDATRIPVPAEALPGAVGDSGETTCSMAREGRWLACGALVLLPTATTQTRTWRWTLPSDVVEWRRGEGLYVLHVQKQAGTPGHRLTVQVWLPEGAVIRRAAPQTVEVAGQTMAYRATLKRDLLFEVLFVVRE